MSAGFISNAGYDNYHDYIYNFNYIGILDFQLIRENKLNLRMIPPLKLFLNGLIKFSFLFYSVSVNCGIPLTGVHVKRKKGYFFIRLSVHGCNFFQKIDTCVFPNAANRLFTYVCSITFKQMQFLCNL